MMMLMMIYNENDGNDDTDENDDDGSGGSVGFGSLLRKVMKGGMISLALSCLFPSRTGGLTPSAHHK